MVAGLHSFDHIFLRIGHAVLVGSRNHRLQIRYREIARLVGLSHGERQRRNARIVRIVVHIHMGGSKRVAERRVECNCHLHIGQRTGDCFVHFLIFLDGNVRTSCIIRLVKARSRAVESGGRSLQRIASHRKRNLLAGPVFPIRSLLYHFTLCRNYLDGNLFGIIDFFAGTAVGVSVHSKRQTQVADIAARKLIFVLAGRKRGDQTAYNECKPILFHNTSIKY